MEKEIRDLFLPFSVPPINYSGDINDLVKRRGALKREMKQRESEGRVYGGDVEL